jgi:diamine N-acetyltransferase
MFFYHSSEKFKFETKLYPLSQKPEWLPQAANWVENKWGYIRQLGVAERTRLMTDQIANLYILSYAEQPIGMFGLLNYAGATNTKELYYVYVDECFRFMGLGSRLVKEALEVAKKQGVSLIVLDTLNPNLNKFYEKLGATVVCESQLYGCPTSFMRLHL